MIGYYCPAKNSSISSRGRQGTVNAIPERWVSVEVVADHLGVAKESIYRWIEGRSLPAHRIGRLWKFKLSEVDEWVRAGSAVLPGDTEPNRRTE